MTTPTTKQPTEKSAVAENTCRVNFVAPRIDVGESADAYLIVVNLPGTSLEDIEIAFESQKMHLVAQPMPRQGDGVQSQHEEYQVGEYRRSFDLEICNFDVDRVHAVYQNGILTVRLPKAERLKPRRIEIKSA